MKHRLSLKLIKNLKINYHYSIKCIKMTLKMSILLTKLICMELSQLNFHYIPNNAKINKDFKKI